jgi:hypothetical protein
MLCCYPDLKFVTISGDVDIMGYRRDLNKRLIIPHGGLSLPLNILLAECLIVDRDLVRS